MIAAPLPEPLVDGKVAHRVRSVSAAVQFKAANGNEQGELAVLRLPCSLLHGVNKTRIRIGRMSDDGSMIVGIDDERGHERAHLYYIPKRGSGVALTGENGTQLAMLSIPSGGADPN